MNRYAALLVLLPFLSACASTQELDLYEYDLVAMVHNSDNGYTLMVYQDVLGEARHVLRRNGICEVILTYTPSGAIKLNERGRHERTLMSYEAGQLTEEINVLLNNGQSMQVQPKRISSLHLLP